MNQYYIYSYQQRYLVQEHHGYDQHYEKGLNLTREMKEKEKGVLTTYRTTQKHTQWCAIYLALALSGWVPLPLFIRRARLLCQYRCFL